MLGALKGRGMGRCSHLVSQRFRVPTVFRIESSRVRTYIQHTLPVVFCGRAILHSHTSQSTHELRCSEWWPSFRSTLPEQNESHHRSWVMLTLGACSQQWAAWLCSRHEASCTGQQNRRQPQIICFLIWASSCFICIQLVFLGSFQKHACSKPIWDNF